MFKNMLNNIIAILVLHEPLRVPVQLVENGRRLLVHAMLQYSLNNSTPVRVRRQMVHLLQHVAHYEIDRARLATLDAFLNNVVSVLILDALDDVALELVRHLHLILGANALQRLLNHPAPIHLQGQVEHVPAQSLRESRLVLGRAELEKLLNHIIAEHVRHERVTRGYNLSKNQVLFGGCCSLQFLLYEPRPVLVHRELNEMVDYVPKLQMRLTIGAKILKQTTPIRWFLALSAAIARLVQPGLIILR